MEFVRRLQPLATIAEETHGFRYRIHGFDRFVDGTENPREKARAVATLIGEEDRPFASGSYVAVQRYVHDLERWRRLDDGEQEQIIGRTKRGSVELPKAKKTQTAHISRVVIQTGRRGVADPPAELPVGDGPRSRALFRRLHEVP